MTQPPSVLIVAPASSIHTQRWANSIARRGWRVGVATCANHLPGADALDGDVELLPLRWGAPHGYFLDRRGLRRVVDRWKPDVVHAHFASGYGTLTASDWSCPSVLSVWGTDVYDFPHRNALTRRLLRRNLTSFSTLTSTSSAMRDRTLSLYPDAELDITVVPFGVDTERFRPGPIEPVVRTVGTCKSLAPKYGIDDLIRAFAIAAAPQPDLRLRIAGDGPQRAELEALAESLGVAERVEFVGRISYDEVPAFLRTLDVYCALSVDDSESFGVAAVEAMACARPTVLSDVDGFSEVSTADTSIVVPRADPASAAAALSRLTADRELRSRMGSAGRAHVLEHYDWNANVGEMISLYERLLSTRT